MSAPAEVDRISGPGRLVPVPAIDRQIGSSGSISDRHYPLMRQLPSFVAAAGLLLALMGCSVEGEAPARVEPIKNKLDKANAAADAASEAAARAERLSAVVDGAQDAEDTENGDP